MKIRAKIGFLLTATLFLLLPLAMQAQNQRTSINGVAGPFTFSGSGVSCTGLTCTFSGTGSGIGSITWVAPTALFTASPTTLSASGSQTFTLTTATADKVWGNCTGSTTTPSYCSIVSAMLPLATTLAAGAVQPDGTTITVSGGVISSVGGATFQTNGTGLTSSSTINFQNSAATDGLTLTFANPSAGNVKLGFTGTLTNAGLANSAITIAGASVSLGGATASLPSPGAIGGTTPSSGAFTTLSASTSITDSAFSTSGIVTNTSGGLFGTETNTAAYVNFFETVATTLGDLTYGGTSGTPTRLAGYTTANQAVLAQTGTGAASAAPVWTNAPSLSATNMSNFPTFNQNTTGTSGGLLGCSTSTAGSICYWTGSAWTVFAGNNSGNLFLQESAAGVPSWVAGGGGDSITSPNSTLTIGGTSSATTLDVANAATFNNAGGGAASGTTYNGSTARTISYNTLGAAPTASPTFTGTVTTPLTTAGLVTTSSGGVLSSEANCTIAQGCTNATSAAAGQVPNTSSTAASTWTATPTYGIQNTTAGGSTFAGSASAGGSITINGDGASPGTSTISVNTAGTTLNLGSTNATVTTAGVLTVASCSGCGTPSLAFPLTVSGTTTSGGVSYFSNATTLSSSGALTQYGVVYGGGAGGAPASTAADTTTTHALFATATSPAFRAIVSGDIPTLNQNTTGTAGGLTGCTVSTAGAVCYWNGSAWVGLAGNASGTGYLSETSSGVPSWNTGTTSVALSAITAASTTASIANGNNTETWTSALTSNSIAAFTLKEATAATGTSDEELAVTNLAGSTSIPVVITNSLTGSQTLPTLKILPTWNTTGVVDAALLVNATTTAEGAASLLMDLQSSSTTEFNVDYQGNTTAAGTAAANALQSTCTSCGPGAASFLYNTGSIPTLGANSAGWAGPSASGGTSYLWFMPTSTSAGVPTVGSTGTIAGVNGAQVTITALNGSGGGIVTGPTSTTSGDVVDFTGTAGQIADSGVIAANITTNSTGFTTSGVIYAIGSHATASTAAGALGTFLGGQGSSTPPTYLALSANNGQTATYQVTAADFQNYKNITVASGTFTITLVASGSQPANGQYIHVINYGSGVVTIARSGQNINGGTSGITLGAASATSPIGAVIFSDGTNYEFGFLGSAGGSTTANALTMNNSGSGATSGTTFNGASAVTLSYNTIGAASATAATTVNGQTCTLGSTCAIESATSGQVAISGGSGAALTGAADLTYATHTFSGISTTIFDLSAATGTAAFKVPSTTTNTATAAAVIDFDTTNKNYHGFVNGADSIFLNTASAPTNLHLMYASVSAGNTIMVDTGYAYNAIPAGDLPAAIVYNNQANAYTTGLQNFNSATMDLPSSAAYAPTTASLFGYDSTNNRAVLGNGTNTSFLTWITSAPTTLHLMESTGTLGALTDTGIATSTVVTSAAALTANQAVNGSGSQGQATGFTDTAGTITSGHLACYTSSNTIGNCTGTPSNNFLGVFNSSTTWISSGEVSVTLDGSVNVTAGDILCASSTAGESHDNGSTSCATGEWVGIVKTTASSVSSATAFIKMQ